jgi:hypothetical protein
MYFLFEAAPETFLPVSPAFSAISRNSTAIGGKSVGMSSGRGARETVATP